MLIFVLLFTQSSLQAQKCCVECQADVKVVSDKQVLLKKIDLKAGTLTTNVSTNVYVSYRSGNAQKFWTNLVIATAGVAVSTQLNKANFAEGKSTNGVSPLLPLGVSAGILPSIWKNRPRGVPQAGLYIQHRDSHGKLLETWEQPISSEAKNDAELLTVSIDKPLLEGTLEVYLQNGSKNNVYYWGYETTSKSKKNTNTILMDGPVSLSVAGCPSGYLPNGNGMCCNFFNGECVSEGGGNSGSGNPPTSTPTSGGCPSGYLPNGQGMCCSPFTGQCVSEMVAVPTVEGGELPGATVTGTAPAPTPPGTYAGGGVGSSGGSNGGSTYGGGGGNGTPGDTGSSDSDPIKKTKRCQECRDRQSRKLDSDLASAENDFYQSCAACLGFAVGGYEVGKKAGKWISGTDEGGVSGSLLTSMIIVFPCLYYANTIYQKAKVKAYDDYIDNLNSNCGPICN